LIIVFSEFIDVIKIHIILCCEYTNLLYLFLDENSSGSFADSTTLYVRNAPLKLKLMYEKPLLTFAGVDVLF